MTINPGNPMTLDAATAQRHCADSTDLPALSQDCRMSIEDEASAAATAFVTAGRTRLAEPLDALNALADRLGGQNGMVLHALHGVLIAVMSAMLNHVAGIPEPVAVPHEADPTVDRATADPAPPSTPVVDPVIDETPPPPGTYTAPENLI